MNNYIKGIIAIIFVFILISPLYSQDSKKDNSKYVDIHYNNKCIGRMSSDEFTELVKAANEYKEIIDAEKNKKVLVKIKDNPIKITEDTYKTELYVRWENKKGDIIKEVVILFNSKIKMEEDGMLLLFYKDLSYYGFPISMLFNIIFIIILSL